MSPSRLPEVRIPHEEPLTGYLRRHARATPDKPAFVWYGREIGYAELDRASDALAAGLAALGVTAGDPVALFMGNCPQYAIAHFAIQKLGAIVCPCGPLYKEHELQYQLDDLQTRVLIAADTLLPVVDKVRAQTRLAHVLVVHYVDWLPETPTIDVPPELLALRAAPRTVPADCLDVHEMIRAGGHAPTVDVGLDDIALMTYTSGTTGLPKGAMLSHDNALFKTAGAACCNGIAGDDVLLAVAPLYHIAGMLMGLDVTVFTGATTVLLHRFDPRAAPQAISRYRVTWWYSIAPMNVACLQLPDVREHDLSSLKVNPVTSFGITFTEALAAQWRGIAPNCTSHEAAYGLSETHTCDTAMPRDAIRWGRHGLPVPGVQVRILDPDTGEERPRGTPGEIVLKSRGNFQGYWHKPEATAKTLRDGWVHTGDIGVLDEEGYLTFQGRTKEMIKVSGYSVFPEEVESLLVRHPAVAQAAVRSVPDAEKGEVVRAFIVRKPGAELDEAGLIAWSRENMAAYKAPRSVRFIDALPATGAGKVLRRLLPDE